MSDNNDILKKILSWEKVDDTQVSILMTTLYTDLLNATAQNLSANILKTKSKNHDHEKVLSDFIHICKKLFSYTDNENRGTLIQEINKIDDSNMLLVGEHLSTQISLSDYNPLEIFASGQHIKQLITDIKEILLRIQMLDALDDRSEERLWIFVNKIVDKMIELIKHFNSIIPHIEKTIEQEYHIYNEMFLENIESFFGSMPTYNVHFTYENNRLLTQLYTSILDSLSHGIKLGNGSNMIHIFKSEEYQAICDRHYITQIQAVNFANTEYILAPVLWVLVDLHKYDLSKQPLTVQNTCKDLSDEKIMKLILAHTKHQHMRGHIIESLHMGNYTPNNIRNIEKKQEEVWDTRLIIAKKNIFKDFENIAKFIRENRKAFQDNFLPWKDKDSINIDSIDIYYTTYKLKGGKDLWFKDEYIKYFEMLQKLEKKISEYTTSYEKWTKGKSTDTERGENVDHYSFAMDNHGLIKGLTPQTLSKPAPVIWSSIDTIKKWLLALLDKDPLLHSLNESYSGSEKNLLNNYIVVWPLGTGKTALLRELWYNKDFVTIATSYGDITSMRFGTVEKNVLKMFEQAYKIHQETGKQVLLLIDEFDMFFNIKSSMWNNTKEGIQKEMQIALDGVVSYPGVHLIGLSNVPQGIPMDIYRRVKTFVIEKLENKEIVALIQSRLSRYSIDKTMQEVYTYISDYRQDTANPYWDIVQLQQLITSSPKIITSLCKQVVDVYFAKILAWTDKKAIKLFWKKLKKLNANKKSSDEAYHKLFSQLDVHITREDFIKVASKELENPVIQQEIEVYTDFYEHVYDHIGRIKWSFQGK